MFRRGETLVTKTNQAFHLDETVILVLEHAFGLDETLDHFPRLAFRRGETFFVGGRCAFSHGKTLVANVARAFRLDETAPRGFETGTLGSNLDLNLGNRTPIDKMEKYFEREIWKHFLNTPFANYTTRI